MTSLGHKNQDLRKKIIDKSFEKPSLIFYLPKYEAHGM